MASLYSVLFIYVCISLLLPSHIAKYYATTAYASRENCKGTDIITVHKFFIVLQAHQHLPLHHIEVRSLYRVSITVYLIKLSQGLERSLLRGNNTQDAWINYTAWTLQRWMSHVHHRPLHIHCYPCQWYTRHQCCFLWMFQVTWGTSLAPTDAYRMVSLHDILPRNRHHVSSSSAVPYTHTALKTLFLSILYRAFSSYR